MCERVCYVCVPLCLGDMRSWMTQCHVSVYWCRACAHASGCRHLCLCLPVRVLVHGCLFAHVCFSGCLGMRSVGQAQLPRPMPTPSHPAGRVGNSLSQALPLAR